MRRNSKPTIAPKQEIACSIAVELIAAQQKPFEIDGGCPLPLMLWDGAGRSVKASRQVIELVRQYAILTVAERKLEATMLIGEMHKLVGHAFAILALSGRLIDQCGAVCTHLSDNIDRLLIESVNRAKGCATYHFGCTLFDVADHPTIEIGPVSFRPRGEMVQALLTTGAIDAITAERLNARWAGQHRRSRKDQAKNAVERDLFDTLAGAAVACSVRTGAQSSEMAPKKALHAARLAMAALSLAWERPSRAIRGMSLAGKGAAYRRVYAVSGTGRGVGAAYATIGSPRGVFVQDWSDTWAIYEPLMAPLADALWLYVDPQRAGARTAALKSLFMAIWWFDEACREDADPMALAKFASVLDALASGKRAAGIKNLILHRLGRPPLEPWFTDGQTPAALVHATYEIARNGMYHGSIQDFDRDWSHERERAEFVCRQCLLATLAWLAEHPTVTSLKAMQRP